MLTSGTGIAYTNALVDLVIEKNKSSAIVKVQEEKDYNVLTNELFSDETMTKENMLGYLGADSIPVAIYIYPNNFESKDNIITYLDMASMI